MHASASAATLTCVLALMGARLDENIDLETLWEAAQETHTDTKACGCISNRVAQVGPRRGVVTHR